MDLFVRSRAVALPFLPVLHSRDDHLAFFGASIAASQITLAVADGECVGFLAQSPGWIEQLYLEPTRRGQGIGRTLLDHAKSADSPLQLWCFADNHSAIRFYERQGFREVRRTDGDNEEGLPDILYVWRRTD